MACEGAELMRAAAAGECRDAVSDDRLDGIEARIRDASPILVMEDRAWLAAELRRLRRELAGMRAAKLASHGTRLRTSED